MNKLKKYFKKINTRSRFLIYSFLVIILMALSFYLLKVYSSYDSKTTINTKIEKAIYIIDEDTFSFNIDVLGIVPSDDPYIYKFSISNYNDTKQSSVDLEYSLSFRTTTNLPLKYELYRNQEYDSENAVNLFYLSSQKQDEDGSWYNVFNLPSTYTFNYKEKTKDEYSLVVYFPKEYSNNIEYADLLDNIEVKVNAEQIID